MAALLGREVLTRDYETVRIRIAFHPQEGRFEVANPAIRKDVAWIPDIADLFDPKAKLLQITRDYTAANSTADENEVFGKLEQLRKITNNHVGIIELADDLDIETVTEIFIRVNSAGTELSQADFAMSKIAVNETLRRQYPTKSYRLLLSSSGSAGILAAKSRKSRQGICLLLSFFRRCVG